MMDGSPIMGVLTPKSEPSAEESPVSEARIQKAIWERSEHFLENSETMTLVGVRRILEEDLGLEKNALDPYKKYISLQIDQVFNAPKKSKSEKDVERNSDSSGSKELGKTSGKSESLIGESDHTEDNVKSRKETARKKKKLDEQKKRKRSKESDKVSSKKNKFAKNQKDENYESDIDGNVSENDQSQSSVEKPAVRKEKLTSGYEKKVENLKSIIKACGMSVAPSVYKKAKQLHEDKRDEFIVKELEGVLSREGLSKNPSEKEIKDCRKRKETAKELEGIDTSNIISSTRRRSAFSFAASSKLETVAKVDRINAKNNRNKDKDNKDIKKDDCGEEEKKIEVEQKKTGEDGGEEIEEEEEEEEKEEEEEEDEDGTDEEEEGNESEDFNEDDNEGSD